MHFDTTFVTLFPATTKYKTTCFDREPRNSKKKGARKCTAKIGGKTTSKRVNFPSNQLFLIAHCKTTHEKGARWEIN
jgi:hypothetical protein